MLPGVDGFTLLPRLRSSKINVPVLCLTAKDTVEDRVKDNVPGACRIKVTLLDIRPPIWRRIEIGTGVTFRYLRHRRHSSGG